MIGLLPLFLPLLLTACATTEVKVVHKPLPAELIGVRDVCTLTDQDPLLNADLVVAYLDCASKLKKANMRFDAIQEITGKE